MARTNVKVIMRLLIITIILFPKNNQNGKDNNKNNGKENNNNTNKKNNNSNKIYHYIYMIMIYLRISPHQPIQPK